VLTLSIAVQWLTGPVITPEVTDPKPNPDRAIFTGLFVVSVIPGKYRDTDSKKARSHILHNVRYSCSLITVQFDGM
jgi:hypothetical protein